MWHALLILSILITVVRVRQLGVSWLDIIATPTQWLHFVVFGGLWGHTVCSCTGLHMRDGHRNIWFWRSLQIIFDIVFILFERQHCAASLQRAEKERA